MAEYIDRTVLLNHLKNCKGQPPEMCYTFAVIQAIESFVKNSPAADVVEAVHAKWVNINGTQAHYCNQCGMDFDLFAYCKDKFLYCPYCGAKMDLEEHHESNYL